MWGLLYVTFLCLIGTCSSTSAVFGPQTRPARTEKELRTPAQ